MSSELPEDWPVKSVGDIADILDSRRIPLNSEERRIRQGPYPYWGANGVVDHIDDYLFDEPLVLMAEDGGYFSDAATKPICHRLDGRVWVNNHAHVIRPTGVERDFFYYWFVHRDITQFVKGGTRSKLNQSDLKRLPISLPPLDEQRRIAEVLRSVDELLTSHSASISAARSMRQAALDAMMREETEAADSDLQPLEAVAEVRTGAAKNGSREGEKISLPYLRVANVQDGWIDLTEIKTIEIDPNTISRYSLKKGDVLLTEGGDFDKLGRGGVWSGEIDPCLHQNHVFAVRPDRERLLSEFLALVTQSYLGRAYFLSCAKRTTNLASINSSQLKKLPVPSLTLRQQQDIVSKIGSIDSFIRIEQQEEFRLKRLRSVVGDDLLSGRVRVPA